MKLDELVNRVARRCDGALLRHGEVDLDLIVQVTIETLGLPIDEVGNISVSPALPSYYEYPGGSDLSRNPGRRRARK